MPPLRLMPAPTLVFHPSFTFERKLAEFNVVPDKLLHIYDAWLCGCSRYKAIQMASETYYGWTTNLRDGARLSGHRSV